MGTPAEARTCVSGGFLSLTGLGRTEDGQWLFPWLVAEPRGVVRVTVYGRAGGLSLARARAQCMSGRCRRRAGCRRLWDGLSDVVATPLGHQPTPVDHLSGGGVGEVMWLPQWVAGCRAGGRVHMRQRRWARSALATGGALWRRLCLHGRRIQEAAVPSAAGGAGGVSGRRLRCSCGRRMKAAGGAWRRWEAVAPWQRVALLDQ